MLLLAVSSSFNYSRNFGLSFKWQKHWRWYWIHPSYEVIITEGNWLIQIKEENSYLSFSWKAGWFLKRNFPLAWKGICTHPYIKLYPLMLRDINLSAADAVILLLFRFKKAHNSLCEWGRENYRYKVSQQGLARKGTVNYLKMFLKVLQNWIKVCCENVEEFTTRWAEEDFCAKYWIEKVHVSIQLSTAIREWKTH
jgi:hypothetical protein